MNAINKVIGGFLGFLFAGPIGCFLGILIGHIFDKNFYHQYDANFRYQNLGVQPLFFEITFLVMGYISKLEGSVSQSSIDNARKIMHTMALNESSRLQAMHLFNQGKQPDFALDITLSRLLIISHQDKALLKQFLVIQTQAAIENGVISPAKRKGLMTIYRALGFKTIPFNWFEPFVEASYTYESYQRKNHYEHNRQQDVFYNRYNNDFNPYQILGVSEKATIKEIKQAYRRLLNQLHPDKLVSKGLSKKELEQAKQKMIAVQKAYEVIQKSRRFS